MAQIRCSCNVEITMSKDDCGLSLWTTGLRTTSLQDYHMSIVRMPACLAPASATARSPDGKGK